MIVLIPAVLHSSIELITSSLIGSIKATSPRKFKFSTFNSLSFETSVDETAITR